MCSVAIVLMREVLIARSFHASELMGRFFVSAVLRVPFSFVNFLCAFKKVNTIWQPPVFGKIHLCCTCLKALSFRLLIWWAWVWTLPEMTLPRLQQFKNSDIMSTGWSRSSVIFSRSYNYPVVVWRSQPESITQVGNTGLPHCIRMTKPEPWITGGVWVESDCGNFVVHRVIKLSPQINLWWSEDIWLRT